MGVHNGTGVYEMLLPLFVNIVIPLSREHSREPKYDAPDWLSRTLFSYERI